MKKTLMKGLSLCFVALLLPLFFACSSDDDDDTMEKLALLQMIAPPPLAAEDIGQVVITKDENGNDIKAVELNSEKTLSLSSIEKVSVGEEAKDKVTVEWVASGSETKGSVATEDENAGITVIYIPGVGGKWKITAKDECTAKITIEGMTADYQQATSTVELNIKKTDEGAVKIDTVKVTEKAKETGTKEDKPAKDLLAEGIQALNDHKYDLAISKMNAAYAKEKTDETKTYYALSQIAQVSTDQKTKDFIQKYLGVKDYPATVNALLSTSWMKNYQKTMTTRVVTPLEEKPKENESLYETFIRCDIEDLKIITDDDYWKEYQKTQGRDMFKDNPVHTSFMMFVQDKEGDWVSFYDTIAQSMMGFQAKSITPCATGKYLCHVRDESSYIDLLGYTQEKGEDYKIEEYEYEYKPKGATSPSSYTEKTTTTWDKDGNATRTAQWYDAQGNMIDEPAKLYYGTSISYYRFTEYKYKDKSGKLVFTKTCTNTSGPWVDTKTEYKDATGKLICTEKYNEYKDAAGKVVTSFPNTYYVPMFTLPGEAKEKETAVLGEYQKTPDFDDVSWLSSSDVYKEGLFAGTKTTTSLGLLFIANALERNKDGLNPAVDDLLSIVSERLDKASAAIGEIAEGAVVISDETLTSFGLKEILGEGPVKIGKSEMNAVLAALEVVKATLQYLQSYDLSYNTSEFRKSQNFWKMSSQELISAINNATVANTLKTRKQDSLALSKKTFVSAFKKVCNSYDYITSPANTTCPQGAKDTITKYCTNIRRGADLLISSIENGSTFYVPKNPIDETLTSWPTAAGNDVFAVDMKELFTPGVLGSLLERKQDGSVQLYAYVSSSIDSSEVLPGASFLLSKNELKTTQMQRHNLSLGMQRQKHTTKRFSKNSSKTAHCPKKC